MNLKRVKHWAWLGIACSMLLGCSDEPLPGEAEGAYLLFRQAMFDKDVDKVYDYLNKDTQALFDARVAVMGEMSERIKDFLPQVDQKLARRQTGVTLLKEHKLETGRDLFKLLFNAEMINVTEEVKVGSDVADWTYTNEEETEALLVTYGRDQYRLVLEEDKTWRVASWHEFVKTRTSWIVSNSDALDQTIQDLQEEEKEEMDKVIKFLLKRG